MSALKLSVALCLCVLVTLAPSRGQQVSPASDPYRSWAVQQWGAAMVNDPAQEANVWGQNADSDHDGQSNLYEYALGTDPKQPNVSPVTYDFGKTNPGYLTLNYTQRADDAGLVIFPQYSNDLQTWWPVPPRDAFSWPGDGTYFWNTTTGTVMGGMQSVTRVCAEPLASSPAAFSRVLVKRNGSVTIGSPLDAVKFFDGISGVGGSSVDSNSVVLSGFSGTVNVTVTGGAHLIVNGVDVGTSANVAAGSTIRIRAISPTTSGSTANYNLSIGGAFTTAWNVVTRTTTAPALTVPPGVSSTASGYTPVSASVGEGGAASIDIPITVPPGTAGMEPKLSIVYSSQGGNGLLGMGFGLTGLSAITRTGPVPYLDPVKGGVSFGPNDRFTVDGQRLVLYSGTWGSDGSQYRTEQESFSQITSQGTTGYGPQSWIMKTKAGLIYEYGTTANSQVLANRSSVTNDPAVLMWALTRIRDSNGNSVEFAYATPDGTESGNPRIVSIAYTKNTGLTPNEQVIFSYETRPDLRTSYVAGAKVVLSKRLTAIECLQGGNVVRRCEFTYQQAETSGNSQLLSVTEKGKKPTNNGDVWQVFPATNFTWDKQPAVDMTVVTPTQVPALANMKFGRSPPTLTVQGDFDGTGRMGLMYFDEYGGPSFWLARGNNDGSFNFKQGISDFTASDAIDHSNNTTYSCIRTGDFNSDGKTDVVNVTRNGTTNWVALSRGDGTFQVLRGQAQLGDLYGVGQTGDYTSQVFALDLNGDGLTDLVFFYATKPSVVLLGNGDGSFKKIDPSAAVTAIRVTDGRPAYQWVLPGDYNGDGLADILFLYRNEAGTTNHQLLLSKGNGTFDLRSDAQLGGLHNQGFALSYAYIVSGDFNGDGLTDVYNVDEHGSAWVSYAKGDGTFEATAFPATLQGYEGSSSGPPYSQFVSGDFNGDGFSDIIHASYAAPANFLIYSQGNGAFSVLKNGQMGVLDNRNYATDDPSRLFVGDFNGDGREDFLCLNYGGTTNFLVRSNGFNANRVVQVTNGHGGYTKFNYKPLTDPTVYTKGTASVYPNYDMTGAMYVVSSVTTRNAVDGDAFPAQTSPSVVESTVTYTYERATAVLDGHGYQGFAAVQSTSRSDGQNIDFINRTEYVTGDPTLVGHPAHTVQTLSNGVVVSETLNTWISNPTTLPSGMKTYFPYTTQSVSKNYEINNGLGAAPVKTTTVSGQTYDGFGNLTHSLTDYGGGFTEETTSSYTNDTTNWWLGRLSDTVVKQTSPGPVTATRHSTFQYSPTNGQLTRETIVTPESNLRLQKDYVHDGFGNIKQSTLTDLGTGATRTTSTTYTPDGRFINQTTNARNQTESKTYDPLNGTVLTQTGPNGLTTVWTYDGFGRPATETRPDGTQTYTWYLLCAPGNGVPPRAVHCVISQSSGSGPAAVYFDILDRQIRQDATGFDGSTVSTHTVFDAKGETLNTSLPFFSSSSTPTAPSAQYTTNYFDAIGRVIQQNVPGGTTESGQRITTTAYAGLTATVTNPKKQTFQMTSDLRGRTMSSTSFGTDTVTNTHDPYGNLVQVSDGHSHLTTLTYDGRGNKIRMVEPNSGTTTYGYNAFGELTSQTDALGRTTTLSYDALGRMTKRIEPDAPMIYNGVQAAGFPVETDWVYENGPDGKPNPNGIGKLGFVWRQSDGYLESYRYDRLGRLTETLTQTGSMQFVTATTFDEYSRPDTLSYPTGFAVRNAYNQYGHLAAVYDAATPSLKYWTATSVNARGQVVQEQFGNGLTTVRGYDPYTGLLSTIQTGTSSGSGSGVSVVAPQELPVSRVRASAGKVQTVPASRLTAITSSVTPSVQNLAYTFDNLNNLTKRQDLNRGVTESFTYDATNQLSGTTCSAAAAVTINCDHLGNIVNRSDVGAYTYGENRAGPHAVTSITGTNGQPSRTLSYNAVGNCTQDGDTKLSYNAANQPVSIQAASGSILFNYTPTRGRLKRTELISGALTNRVYVGSLYERDDGPRGIVHTHFIPAGGGAVAIWTQTQTTGGTSSQTRYIHKDHLGSIHTLTKEDGTIDEVLSFDAWGRRRTLAFDRPTQSLRYSYGTVTSQTDRGFTGHEMLDIVGLIHMNGRIYDPTIGRFLSVDPVVQEAGNLQNLNRYCYVLNNPLSLTDPSGFSFFGKIGKFFEKNWKTIAAIGVGVLTGGLAAWAIIPGITSFGAGLGALVSGAGGFGGALVVGAASGFGSAFTGTLLSGGSIGDAFRAGVTGSAWGAASAGAFQQIDIALPDWARTRPLPNETMISASRLLGQVERVAFRGVASAGFAYLEGGKGNVAFWRSAAFDGVSLGQDILDETEFRDEWALPNHGGHTDWNTVEGLNQGFATAQQPAQWKPAYGIGVYNNKAVNFGTPWGEIAGFTEDSHDLSLLTLTSEGSGFTNFAAYKVPGLHQVSLYHDMFVTAFEGTFSNATARSIANYGSMVPYAAFVYSKYGNEQRMRTGRFDN